MKVTDKTRNLLNEIAATPANRIKVDVEAVRGLAQSDALNRSAVLAAVSMLTYLAEKTPMAFEERKNVEVIVDSLQAANPNDTATVDASIKALTDLVGYYNQ